MGRFRGGLWWCALVLATAACASRGAPRPAIDRNLLVTEQFSERGFNTPYDVIASLRSNWLAERGPDSFMSPTKVQVYLDGIRMGGVETLRTMDIRPVVYIRHFDGLAATARWGLDHGSGAIYVSTHPLTDTLGVRTPE